MANTVSSVLSFFLMIGVVVVVVTGALRLTDSSAGTQTALQRAAADAALGSLSVVDAVASLDAGAANVDVTILNDGGLSYAQFDGWHVNVNYTNGAGGTVLASLPYAETLAPATWYVEGVYQDAARSAVELVEPSVVNPAEYLVLRIRLSDGVLKGARGWAVVTPADGAALSVFFDA